MRPLAESAVETGDRQAVVEQEVCEALRKGRRRRLGGPQRGVVVFTWAQMIEMSQGSICFVCFLNAVSGAGSSRQA